MATIRYEDYSRFSESNQFERIHRRSEKSFGEQRYRRPSAKTTESEEFKCGHCRTFVGPPISGGRHRNHCPLCLYSKHVDAKSPGDRRSDCRSLMAPVGTFFRKKGEQVVVHRCLGCGAERYCRVAADDHIVTCMRLPIVAMPGVRDEDRKEMAAETA